MKARAIFLAIATISIVNICPAAAQPIGSARALEIDDATLLSEFGGRPAFSPDGKRIAFVGRTYGDAFEIDLDTRKVRNLTRDMPHHGIVRIQYLFNGDFLITAPRRSAGPNTRAHLELWVLDPTLQKGLRPLGVQVFEGVAVSRRANRIAWTSIEPGLKPNESWQMGFASPTKRFVGEISYPNGVPALTEKREIMPELPAECMFIEPQDFRSEDRELVFSCMGRPTGSVLSISVMGIPLPDGPATTYFRRGGEYAEAEGIAPDGSWTTVECGSQEKSALPPLDICRLEIAPHGAMTRLVIGSRAGREDDISNPVVSPAGRSIAFQRSLRDDPDIGGGNGIYLLSLLPGRR